MEKKLGPEDFSQDPASRTSLSSAPAPVASADDEYCDSSCHDDSADDDGDDLSNIHEGLHFVLVLPTFDSTTLGFGRGRSPPPGISQEMAIEPLAQ